MDRVIELTETLVLHDQFDPPTPQQWSYKDIDDFHNRVRALLSISAVSSLTDAAIDMPERAPTAERVIKSYVPNWQEYKDTDYDKFLIFESCIVYQTAIYFESYVIAKQPKRMQTSSINVEFSTSGNIKQGPLRSLQDYLQDLLEQLQEDIGSSFFGFRVT